MSTTEAYVYLQEKIAAMKRDYPLLRDKTDEYVFTALCVRANYYKNPALDFTPFLKLSLMVNMMVGLMHYYLIPIQKQIILSLFNRNIIKLLHMTM